MIWKKPFHSGLLVSLYLFSGCVPAVKFPVNPSFHQRAASVRQIAVLPPEVKVHQVDAGGVKEEMAEWSAQARSNVVAALEKELKSRLNAEVKIFTEETATEEKARFEETLALQKAVWKMVFIHTYPNPNLPNQVFEEKVKNFDYSLGSEVGNLTHGADMLLLLDAEDHVWTGGRQALQALGVIIGLGAAVATGVVIIPQLGGGTTVKAALVDGRTGDILWLNAVGAGAGKDLRDAGSTNEMMNQLFANFLSRGDGQEAQEGER